VIRINGEKQRAIELLKQMTIDRDQLQLKIATMGKETSRVVVDQLVRHIGVDDIICIILANTNIRLKTRAGIAKESTSRSGYSR
jgi:hypothetical protein